jgi:hypothetical protein
MGAQGALAEQTHYYPLAAIPWLAILAEISQDLRRFDHRIASRSALEVAMVDDLHPK